MWWPGLVVHGVVIASHISCPVQLTCHIEWQICCSNYATNQCISRKWLAGVCIMGHPDHPAGGIHHKDFIASTDHERDGIGIDIIKITRHLTNKHISLIKTPTDVTSVTSFVAPIQWIIFTIVFPAEALWFNDPINMTCIGLSQHARSPKHHTKVVLFFVDICLAFLPLHACEWTVVVWDIDDVLVTKWFTDPPSQHTLKCDTV